MNVTYNVTNVATCWGGRDCDNPAASTFTCTESQTRTSPYWLCPPTSSFTNGQLNNKKDKTRRKSAKIKLKLWTIWLLKKSQFSNIKRTGYFCFFLWIIICLIHWQAFVWFIPPFSFFFFKVIFDVEIRCRIRRISRRVIVTSFSFGDDTLKAVRLIGDGPMAALPAPQPARKWALIRIYATLSWWDDTVTRTCRHKRLAILWRVSV